MSGVRQEGKKGQASQGAEPLLFLVAFAARTKDETQAAVVARRAPHNVVIWGICCGVEVDVVAFLTVRVGFRPRLGNSLYRKNCVEWVVGGLDRLNVGPHSCVGVCHVGRQAVAQGFGGLPHVDTARRVVRDHVDYAKRPFGRCWRLAAVVALGCWARRLFVFGGVGTASLELGAAGAGGGAQPEPEATARSMTSELRAAGAGAAPEPEATSGISASASRLPSPSSE
jgi:hypothetical protein